MELPAWAFEASTRVQANGSIDVVFSLRPLARIALVLRALMELARTRTITIKIVFEKRPNVTFAGAPIRSQAEAFFKDERKTPR